MKTKNRLIRSTGKCEVRAAQEVPPRANRRESTTALHQKLLRLSLWDSLNKDRKEPMSFAFKITPTSVLNRVLAVEYMSRHRGDQ